MDIDYFKSINDRYGHKAGDVVLQETSAIIVENIGKTDLAARWGGEEFIVLFHDTSTENAANAYTKVSNFSQREPICI